MPRSFYSPSIYSYLRPPSKVSCARKYVLNRDICALPPSRRKIERPLGVKLENILFRPIASSHQRLGPRNRGLNVARVSWLYFSARSTWPVTYYTKYGARLLMPIEDLYKNWAFICTYHAGGIFCSHPLPSTPP